MAANNLEMRLLGDFALLLGGRKLPPITQKKGRVLVAHLALKAGHEVFREDIAAHFWPDSETDRALFNLRQLIARIRRGAPDLSPYILAENRSTLRFQSNCLVDAIEFRKLVRSMPEPLQGTPSG